MTVAIPITNGPDTLLLDEDAERVAALNTKWRVIRNQDGSVSGVLSTRCLNDGQPILLHRFLLDAPAGVEVDHIDRNPLNNQRDNLRLATGQENSRNRRGWVTGTSQYKGVSWARDVSKWRAVIHVSGRQIHLGYFTNEDDAARAYNAAARAHFGEFAVLNDVPDEVVILGEAA